MPVYKMEAKPKCVCVSVYACVIHVHACLEQPTVGMCGVTTTDNYSS